MSDDLNKKVQQIAQMLGQEDPPDKLKELIALLAASLGTKDGGTVSGVSAVSDSADNSPVDKSLTDKSNADKNITEKSVSDKALAESSTVDRTDNTPAANTDILDTAKKIISRVNNERDPRVNLLQAIKPFMNSKRQKKISNCIQLLQAASLSRMLNEREK